VASEAPPFWWEPSDWRALALWPASALYGLVAGHRMRRAARQPVEAPVLCIGNFTVGGTGKTPTAIAFAHAVRQRGLRPGFLSRGHGGNFARPHLVDPAHDSARLVGDEPLLLAAHAPVAVTPNRALGARLLIEQGCNFLIMDDGFQSARIHIDYALAVVDARHGVGNGHVIPGGPLRAPLARQLHYADALLRMGKGEAADDLVRQASRAGKPVFEASTRPLNAQAVAGRRYLAFAGIGHPERFFMTAISAGAHLSLTRSFGDHHVYTPEELAELETNARKADIRLLTTAKDAARLHHMGVGESFLARLDVLEIETVFENADAVDRIIAATLRSWNQRKLQK
jgi:tetraacyldisaccharide 4'-kinase